MQKIAREFLQFRRGIILKNILENDSGLIHKPTHKKHFFQPLKLFSLNSHTRKQASITGRTSPQKDSCKTCRQRLKCRRSPLPWEVQKQEPKPKGILPLRKLAEVICDEEISKAKPCRACPMTEPKMKPSKKRKSAEEEDCRPFHDQGQAEKEKTTECERRRMRKCRKIVCYPELECKNLAPICGKPSKVYPVLDYMGKLIKGSPIPGWEEMHRKARLKCDNKKEPKKKDSKKKEGKKGDPPKQK